MEIRKGIAVSPGLAIAPAIVLDSEQFRIPRRNIEPREVEAELARFQGAVERALGELRGLRQRIATDIGEKLGAIFDVQDALLTDPHVSQEIRELIQREHYAPEYAVSTVLRGYAKKFLSLPNRYMSERVSDVYDVEKRLLRNLIGAKRESLGTLTEPAIIISHDLTPSQTASLDRSKILAFATDSGGRTSHTAIVARAMGIPAVVGLKNITADVSGGDSVIVDGNRGLVIINPDEASINRFRVADERYRRMEKALGDLRDLPAVTLDGHEVKLWGNMEFPHDVETCLARGASGIGLYRTEFLYLDRDCDPTEEDHFQAYAEAIDLLKGRPITIRTCDLGADKFTHLSGDYDERNPFLGCRSIRFSLQHIGLFKTQLRAILRASALGPTRAMFPLVTNLKELRQAKMLLNDVREDLEEEGVLFDPDMKVGIMIEVPSAAIMARHFAKECDFFSIGTNDLVQYTLAVDRSNERVATMYTPGHPAVLRLIRTVAEAAGESGVDLAVCGEMAGEPIYTPVLLGLGVQVFSVSPATLLEIKKVIRSITMDQAREVCDRVFQFDSDREVDAYLGEIARRLLPEMFA
ncbi:MAG: phosphoenolpyruvate--protein phosphotransferase [Planctomycetota bacterium]|nr:phosphoenolpyruvate--protein phosphotransferase [Planctomycetota bacterium]